MVPLLQGSFVIPKIKKQVGLTQGKANPLQLLESWATMFWIEIVIVCVRFIDHAC